MSWEESFARWAQAPSKTEQEKIGNAENAVRNAIAASPELSKHKLVVSVQGSYRNRTNVRRDSDLDISVTTDETFFYKLPDGMTKEQFGIVDASYKYPQYKNELQSALVSYFGDAAVIRSSKTLTVRENTYHVSADVTPFFEHRRYASGGGYEKGYEFSPDNSIERVINWHDQHYANGNEKNNNTGRRYRSIVRVLKTLQNHMEENNQGAARDIPGFLVECLVWNTPNNHLTQSSYSDSVRETLAFLYHATANDDACVEWREVSELKYLFRTNQKWTRAQANSFILAAWRFLGF